MYPIGLPSFLWLIINNVAWVPFVLLCGFLFLIFRLYLHLQRPDYDAPPSLPGFFPFHLISFFREPFAFFNRGLSLTGHTLFQFRLWRDNIIVVSGRQGRADFLNARSLDLGEGFRVLSGALPFVSGVTSDLQQQRIATIYKRLATVQKSDRLAEVIPEVLADCHRIMDSWGKCGSFDPFSKINDLVFQTSVRCLTCVEIANDPEAVATLKRQYDDVDRGTTPITVLFPWFPGPAMLKKLRATKKIYDMVVAIVRVRKESGTVHNDSLQMLLDAGDDRNLVIGFIMGLLIAGARSTGSIASWLITFMGCNATIRQRARAEVQDLISNHSVEKSIDAGTPYLTQLSDVPLSAWEAETPVLDSLIRETLRLAQPHIAMRRNVGPETYIDGKAVPTGSFAVFPFSDVHLNPLLYPDPLRFDPSRPILKEDFAFVGWGGGRVTCLGTRLAKLELKLIVAMFLLNFDFHLVDGDGRSTHLQPQPSWNDTKSCRPSNGSFFIKHQQPS
ncbi:cytochrome P450 [Artomyces pyxidatus]|uniref:Cytochrome P450 n=1 Tax=Artomyces pyxidatus TaxID=48021 RepID=A0ACB8TEK0_9AGAM|nr:cytochrome P450 [Artomyces pyxidatus]